MATSIARKFFKYTMLLLTVAVGVLYVLACLAPSFNYKQYSYMGFIALAFPYLLVALCFLCLFWLFAKPYMAFIPLLLMAVGYNQIQNSFAFNINTTFSKQKKQQHIRIVSWNIQGFNGLSAAKNTQPLVRKEVAESIQRLQPDIVCLQEFNHSFLKKTNTNNIALFTQNYPYYYFSTDTKKNNGYASGSIIFSKYPFTDSGKIKYPKGESLAYVDVLYKQQTVRIYTTHLQSFKFKQTDYNNIEKVAEANNDAYDAGKNIIQKMKPAFKRRALQANMVQQALQQCTHPLIITGDFNDVPTSYTYHSIRGTKQDAFLVKDFGIGKTFIALAPTLRIDYILPDSNFLVQQFDLIDEGLSDHSMLVTDVQLKKKP
jgi:endonuclease/exonuclease/phosphatase family metal-dependent hydrolase